MAECQHSVSHKIIHFKMDQLRKIICMDDFYKAVGLMDNIKSGEIKDVCQFWMNHEQCLEINDLCKMNIRKDRKYKHFTDHYLEVSVGMDWLNYSPVSVPYVPINEIWVWPAEDYETAMEEYREWNKNNELEDK